MTPHRIANIEPERLGAAVGAAVGDLGAAGKLRGQHEV